MTIQYKYCLLSCAALVTIFLSISSARAEEMTPKECDTKVFELKNSGHISADNASELYALVRKCDELRKAEGSRWQEQAKREQELRSERVEQTRAEIAHGVDGVTSNECWELFDSIPEFAPGTSRVSPERIDLYDKCNEIQVKEGKGRRRVISVEITKDAIREAKIKADISECKEANANLVSRYETTNLIHSYLGMIETASDQLRADEAASKISGVANLSLRQRAGVLISQGQEIVREQFARYKTLGGAAGSPDQVEVIPNPCPWPK